MPKHVFKKLFRVFKISNFTSANKEIWKYITACHCVWETKNAYRPENSLPPNVLPPFTVFF